jgi:hypothetical protein
VKRNNLKGTKVIYEKRNEPMTADRLQRLERADATGDRYRNLFPTAQSWKWFRRTRKARLKAAGALIETTAGDLIDPLIFEALLPELLASAGDVTVA